MSEATVSSFMRTTFLLRCPYCGDAGLFRNLFDVHETCPKCNRRLEADRGNFLGAMIINHLLVFTVIAVLAVLDFQSGNTQGMEWRLAVIAAALSAAFYPFTRAFWVWSMLRIQKPKQP